MPEYIGSGHCSTCGRLVRLDGAYRTKDGLPYHPRCEAPVGRIGTCPECGWRGIPWLTRGRVAGKPLTCPTCGVKEMEKDWGDMIAIRNIDGPRIGPRGGLMAKGSITFTDVENHGVMWLHANCPGKWSETQWEMWNEVVGTLKRRFQMERERRK